MASTLIVISVLYLALIFALAYWFDRPQMAPYFKKWSAYIYALSLAVYCSAWTFYGSIGRAASSGLDFLLIYLGPSLVILFWWLLGRKLLLIKRSQGISSLADFISSRYGKSASLGKLVVLLSLLAIIPYIALQIKAISESYAVLADYRINDFQLIKDPAFYISIMMALFTILFGTRYIQGNRPKSGLIAAVALESVLKIVAFVVVGLAAAISIAEQDQLALAMRRLADAPPQSSFEDWSGLLLVSGLAFLLLPRQFQMGVVENDRPANLKTAIWLFPLYLFIINLFVLPFALGGSLLTPGENSDYFILSFTLQTSGEPMAALAYIGGLSAATSMIIVSTLALGNMLSTYFIIPQLQLDEKESLTGKILWVKRGAILLIFVMAYLYYHYLGSNDQLVSIGIISFVGVAQFAPSFLGGLFWPKGHSKGARWSIISGFSLWFFLLVVPSVWPSLAGTSLGLEEFRVLVLRLGYSELSFAIYSSLGVNTLTYIALSLKYSASQAEFHQAQQFVNALSLSKSDTLLYRASADFPDLKSLLIRFLGIKHTEKVLDRYARIHGIDWQSAPQADSRIISFAERLLSEAIGPASARILIARVVDKEELSLDEVVDILEESQRVWQLNRELSRRSDQLKRVTADLRQANAKLLEFSELKDEFLYTVTHELRTPLTSIKTQAEIIYDDREMPNEDRERFLANIVADCDRLTRLINNVLDLEKYDSGNQKLALTFTSIEPLLHQVAASFKGLARKRMVEFSTEIESDLPLTYFDSDRIAQVLHNLLGNAFKYCQPGKGKVVLSARLWQGRILVEVSDNGAGIPETDRQLIFDKFYQVRNQTRRKPAGSGLGLAICKNIVQMHRGNIWVAQSEEGTGARFSFSLPLYEKDSSLSSTHLTSKVLKKT